jgi:Rps23 Pro-64 3,4-dihydroxylase Tpa1-like proline 4-hydroxylase
LQNIEHEILDLGLVYYKNIIKNPAQLIKDIEDLDNDYTLNPDIALRTEVKPWTAWRNESNGTNEIFCWQKFIPQVKNISEDDYFKDRQIDISSQLFGALDETLEHYSNKIYPFAAKNIKSREKTMHLLRYDQSGYLPAHQDQGVSTRVLSVLLYLNDDYEGGEITFRHSGLTLKPKPGSVLFFPSNFLYVHEVAPVTKGPRYALPNWYHNIEQNGMMYSNGSE